MIREVLLITPGRYDSDDFSIHSKNLIHLPNEYRLTPKGVEDARCLGIDILKSGSRPSFIFSTAKEMCVQTAHIIAGRVESIRDIPSAIPGMPVNEREARRKGGLTFSRYQKAYDYFWQNLREAFRSSDGIRMYLKDSLVIPNDAEQIAFVSSDAFNGVFNKCPHKDGTRSHPYWGHPTIYIFTVASQSIELLVPYDYRYGSC